MFTPLEGRLVRTMSMPLDRFENETTLLTPPLGNYLFANYHVLNHPLTNLILSSFYIPKVLKCAAKIMEIGLQIKF